MYSRRLLSYLDTIKYEDILSENLLKILKSVRIGTGTQKIIIAWDDSNKNKRYYFSVIGSAYLLAMAKWLRDSLQKSLWGEIRIYQMNDLIEYFSIPKFRYQDPLLILYLIEKINTIFSGHSINV